MPKLKSHIEQELGISKTARKKRPQAKLHNLLKQEESESDRQYLLDIHLNEAQGDLVTVETGVVEDITPAEQNSIDRFSVIYPTSRPPAGVTLHLQFTSKRYLYSHEHASIPVPPAHPVNVEQFYIDPWQDTQGSEGVFLAYLSNNSLQQEIDTWIEDQEYYIIVTRHPCVIGDRHTEQTAFFPLELDQKFNVHCELLWVVVKENNQLQRVIDKDKKLPITKDDLLNLI